MNERAVEPVTPPRRGGPRVLVVDDHPAFRAAARAMLTASGFRVSGEARTGAEAIAQVDASRPDIVLLDVGLPDLDGFEVCVRLARLEHPPAVILTSSRDAADYAGRIEGASARGFIPKAGLTGEAIRAMVR